jgi:hypothetical protein
MKRRERQIEKIRMTRKRTQIIIGGENWEERNECKEGGNGREEEENKRNIIIVLCHSHTVFLRR